MCGIIGTAGSKPSALGHADLNRALGHRGPDGAGLESLRVAKSHVTLGQTRLSIVDLTDAGSQPMFSASGRWLVAYNGEIYNHSALRSGLNGSFRGHCDTETLVEALDAWGFEQTLARLNGMFGFAALDTESGRLHVARDPFGVKPIYYMTRAGRFTFSSEVRGLRAAHPERPEIAPEGIRDYLEFRYVPSPRTCWKNVKRLEPGHALTYDLNSGRLDKFDYVSPVTERFEGSLDDAVAEYEEILAAAVRRQLLGDVPIGVLLSGGVDSALVAALAVRAGGPTTGYTVGFGESYTECEIGPAAETARFLGMAHESVLISAERALDALEPAVTAVEEPLGTTSILPMWHLSALAAEGVKAVLTGQGSDEPWGGYRRYQGELLRARAPWRAPWAAAASVAARVPHRTDVLERGLRALGANSRLDRFRETYALFTASERDALAGPTQASPAAEQLAWWMDWASKGRPLSDVELMMSVDLRMNLADDLLLYGDKITMAHSLEARVPILDIEVVRFVESLPRHMRLGWQRTKIVHKIAATRLLPSELTNRPKLGFQVPVGDWLRGSWKDVAQAHLFDHSSELGSILDVGAVRSIWDQHQSGRRDRTRQLFALLSLAIWSNRYA